MKTNQELKLLGKELIKNHTGVLAASVFIYFLIENLADLLLGSYASMITPFIALGLYYQVFKGSLGNDIRIKDMFIDLNLAGKFMCESFFISLIQSPILIPVGIAIIYAQSISKTATMEAFLILIASLAVLYVVELFFSQTRFFLIENKDTLGPWEIVEKSIKLSYFGLYRVVSLDISFILLNILAILGLGIPYLWITPYIISTKYQLYLDLKEEYNKHLQAKEK